MPFGVTWPSSELLLREVGPRSGKLAPGARGRGLCVPASGDLRVSTLHGAIPALEMSTLDCHMESLLYSIAPAANGFLTLEYGVETGPEFTSVRQSLGHERRSY